MATKVQKSVRERAIELKQELVAINRELVPVLRELRQRFNELVDEHNQLQTDFDALDVQAYAFVQEEGVVQVQRDIINFIGGGITAADNAGTVATDVTVPLGAGLLFGTTLQVPYMNPAGTNFLYDSEFTYDGTGLSLSSASGYLQLTATDVAPTGNVRIGPVFRWNATGDDIPILDYTDSLGRLTVGGDFGGFVVDQIIVEAETDLVMRNSGGGQLIQLGSGGTSINYSAGVGGIHSFVNGVVYTDTAFATSNGVAASTGLLRAANNTVVVAADAAGAGDLSLVATNGSDVATFGNGSGDTVVNSAATLKLQRAGADKISILSSAVTELTTATVRWTAATTAPNLSQVATSGAACQNLSVIAQPTSNTGGTAGDAILQGGAATAASGTHQSGGARMLVGAATAGGTPLVGNLHLVNACGNFQSMQGGTFIGDSSAAPTGNATGGGFLYVVAGALTWRGSGGSVTTLGPA